MPPTPTLVGDTWSPTNVLAILGWLLLVGLTFYNTIGHRDNKAAIKGAEDKADIAVNQSGKALAATPGSASSAPILTAAVSELAPLAIDPAALQALKDELTAHAESLKQSISSTPLTATIHGGITAGDLAAAHAEMAKAQETPVSAATDAPPPPAAPTGVIWHPPTA